MASWGALGSLGIVLMIFSISPPPGEEIALLRLVIAFNQLMAYHMASLTSSLVTPMVAKCQMVSLSKKLLLTFEIMCSSLCKRVELTIDCTSVSSIPA